MDILATEGIHNPNSPVLHSSSVFYILYQLLADPWGVIFSRLCTILAFFNEISGLPKNKKSNASRGSIECYANILI